MGLTLCRAADQERSLRFSGLAYCGADAYAQIGSLTGFDIASWIARNIRWQADLAPPFWEHIQRNRLDAYLAW